MAAFVLTLRFPLFVALRFQAEKLPLSNPSLKIRSEAPDVGVGVKVGVGVLVGAFVGVWVGVLMGVLVGVRVGVLVDEPLVDVDMGPLVGVGVPVGVGAIEVDVGVEVGVAVFVTGGVFVGVPVGVDVGSGPTDRKLNASTSLFAAPHALPSKYNVGEYVQFVSLPVDDATQVNTSSSAPVKPGTTKSPTVER